MGNLKCLFQSDSGARHGHISGYVGRHGKQDGVSAENVANVVQ